MMSDNGTQFVGAERELREMVTEWDKEQLREFFAEKGMEWKFSTPNAPHHNGCAEVLVKSCKPAQKKAIGNQRGIQQRGIRTVSLLDEEDVSLNQRTYECLVKI